MTSRIIQGSAAATFVLLTACSGGGSGGGVVTPDYVSPFADSDATGTVSLTAVSLNSAARATDTLDTATFDQDADTIAIDGLSGSFDSAGETVTLDGGGLITITPSATEFAARFVSEPQGLNRTIGIVGFETEVSELPTGTVTYTGTSELTILDGTDVYALTGDATITADFGTSLVDTTVNNLDGTVTAGATAPAAVTDVATIDFTGSAITDAQFNGGTAALTSTTLTNGLSGSETTSLDGAFYGPGADEAGAVVTIDDSDVVVLGTVLAD